MLAAQITSLQDAAKGEERERIDYELQRLQELIGPFAERRMNAAISESLSGKHVANV